MSYDFNLIFECDYCYNKVSENDCNQICEKCSESWMSIERVEDAMTEVATKNWDREELNTVRSVLFSLCDNLGNIPFWENLVEDKLTNQKIKS